VYKFLNKWPRRVHRWVAVPIALAIPLVVVIKLMGNRESMKIWEKWNQIPSLLILAMAITGVYLFPLSYIAKLKRNTRRAQNPDK
jgi:uncharacterized membrane protein